MVRFDSLKLLIPEKCILELKMDNKDVITDIKKEYVYGNLIKTVSHKFKNLPLGVTFLTYTETNGLKLEITGKVLKERYKELLNRETIVTALSNALERIGNIDIPYAIEESRVYAAHVTWDYHMNEPVDTTLTDLKMLRHSKYNTTTNDSSVSFHRRAKYKGHVLTVYDKEKELKSNRGFIKQQGKAILEQFSNTLRFELKIYKKKTLGQFFDYEEYPPYLTDLLEYNQNPILKLLTLLLSQMKELPESIPEGSISELEKWLGRGELIKRFRYNYHELRVFLQSHSKGNISRKLRTYNNQIQTMISTRLHNSAYKDGAIERILAKLREEEAE